MKINLLDSSIYNLISAGEVVENPASVVKELVENSIDAGATNVSVYIEDGGIKSIEVIDNGSGIQKDELYKTILPHATSKIKEADDLYTISTLGFRGEALASISAVSEVEIRTKYFDEENGAYLYAKNGQTEIGDCAYSAGTSIKVSNLFYNTPARYKFLASKSTEEGYVTKHIFRLILANPNVAISYYIDNKLTYSSPGNGLKGAVESVFMPKIANSLIEIDNIPSDDNLHITGYISPADVFKNNRNFQIVILNGRVITDQTMSATIQNAYGTRLMSRCFPIYVLNIVMPFDEVDVNVHPNKKEVRFQNARKVYGAIYRAIMRVLEGYELQKTKKLVADFSEISPENSQNLAKKGLVGEQNDDRGSQKSNSSMSFEEALSLVRGNSFNSSEVKESTSFRYNKNYAPLHTYKDESSSKAMEAVSIAPKKTEIDPFVTVESPTLSKSAISTEVQPVEFVYEKELARGVKNYKVVGQFFDTYLAIECADKVIFIDQHAMHERIIYDKLVENWSSGEVSVQPMMVPYIFEGSYEEINAILDNQTALKESGFEIEPFGGNALKISAVPMLIADKLDLGKLLSLMVDEIMSGKLSTLTEFGKDKLASMACKAAIKGGKELDNEQIELVMKYFNEGNMPLQCPHGRPTAIVYTQKEFEKLFRRRV